MRDLRRLRLSDNAAGGLKYGDEVADARQVRRLDDVADAGPASCILTKCLGGDTSVLNGEGLGPIKEVKVGNRLITTEESYLGETAVDEATWKVVRIRMPGSENAGALDLELLRSPEWMAAMGAAIGQEIWLEVPESGVAGFGVVEAIEPCPGIEEGPGRVVLSTIRVRSEDVVQVWLKGLYEPLEATADHPVYSVTREAWMGAGELLAGEEIWALGDTALVLEVDSKPGTYSVFNLEVEGEHVFFVSDLRVLSHNVSSRCPTSTGVDRYEGFTAEGKSAIVLGQNMDIRVMPAAKAIKGGKWLDIPQSDWSWTKNRQFLYRNIKKVKEGRGRILDIGGERGRYQGPKAIYTREKRYLERQGLRRVFTGKWIVSSNGKKFRLHEWIYTGS